MVLSEYGQKLIKSFEGLRLKAYKDSAGMWTIGYGSTRYANERPVQKGDILINEEQASALFAGTLKEYETAVNKAVKVPINQNQFDALVSITYNVGTGVMHNSTLIKKLNDGDYAGVANEFLVWDKTTDPVSHSKVTSLTLLQRRKKERELFLTPALINTNDHDSQKG